MESPLTVDCRQCGGRARLRTVGRQTGQVSGDATADDYRCQRCSAGGAIVHRADGTTRQTGPVFDLTPGYRGRGVRPVALADGGQVARGQTDMTPLEPERVHGRVVHELYRLLAKMARFEDWFVVDIESDTRVLLQHEDGAELIVRMRDYDADEWPTRHVVESRTRPIGDAVDPVTDLDDRRGTRVAKLGYVSADRLALLEDVLDSIMPHAAGDDQ